MVVNTRSSKSAKEIAMEGKSAEARAKIAEIQLRMKIHDDDDDLFWLLSALDIIESLLWKQIDHSSVVCERLEVVKSKYSQLVDTQTCLSDRQQEMVKSFDTQCTRIEKTLSLVKEENRQQWMRAGVCSVGWLFGGLAIAIMSFLYLPSSPIYQARTQQALDALQLVELGFGGDMASGLSWALNKKECQKQWSSGQAECRIKQ